MDRLEEITLRGLPISRGIGIGLPLYFSMDEEIPEDSIPESNIEEQVLRYRHALHLSRQEVEKLQQLSLNEGPPEIVNILGAHLEILFIQNLFAKVCVGSGAVLTTDPNDFVIGASGF